MVCLSRNRRDAVKPSNAVEIPGAVSPPLREAGGEGQGPVTMAPRLQDTLGRLVVSRLVEGRPAL